MVPGCRQWFYFLTGPGELAFKPQCSLVGLAGEASAAPPACSVLPTCLLGAVLSLRGPSCSADHLPGPASPSSLQRDKENFTEVIQPLDSCEFCQPCCPSAQGRDILWGLRLVTPPDLPNLSQWPRSQEPLSDKPHRGVLLAGLGVRAMVITPISPTAGTVWDIMGQDEYSANMDTSALSCLISNFISFAKTDFFFYCSELSWIVPSLTCSHPPTHIYNFISLRNYFLFLLFFLLSFHWKWSCIICASQRECWGPWLNVSWPSGASFHDKCNFLQTSSGASQQRHLLCLLLSLLCGDLGCTHFGEGWVYHVVIPKKLDFLNCSNINIWVKLTGKGGAWFDNPTWNREIETFPFTAINSNEHISSCHFSLLKIN